MSFWLLLWELFRIGALAIGGGMATIVYFFELLRQYPVITNEQLVDMIAISQSTPGAFGINLSTFIGFQTHGILGATLGTGAFVFPSFMAIIAIYRQKEAYQQNIYVRRFFFLLRYLSIILVTVAVYTLWKTLFWTGSGIRFHYLLVFVGFVGILQISNRWKIHPLILIILSGVIGAALGL